MFLALLFFAELFVLFLLSRQVTRLLSSSIYHFTKNKHITVSLMAFLFFPGTVVHELAHYITACLLFVPAHSIELFPKLEGENLKLGSVSIAHTDFFRRLLIGMAPFFVGTSILLGVLYYAASNHLFEHYLFILLIGYIVFEIGNTMFSSKKDMEGALEVLLTLGLIITALSIAGFRLPMIDLEAFFAHPIVNQVFEKGTLFLFVPLGIDVAIIFLLRLLKH